MRELSPARDLELPQDTGAANYNARFSPDGRWLAYTSDTGGGANVYVVPFPHVTRKWMASTNGGAQPVWRGDGEEVFYVAPDGRLMSVTIAAQGTDLAMGMGKPVALFGVPLTDLLSPSNDASADGQKFLINAKLSATAPPLNVMSNGAALPTK